MGDNGNLQEACFAPKGAKAAEGSGYLLGVFSNMVEKRSELLIVDAEKMQEIARVILPFAIAAQVHGMWASHEELPFEA